MTAIGAPPSNAAPELDSRALWFVGPGQVELRREVLSEPGPSEVLVSGLYSAVSQGTEGLLLGHDAPERFDPSLDAPGAPLYPRRYGYAWVGEVVRGALPAGTRVFSLAPHGEAHVLEVARVRVLPPDFEPARATLAASCETALNAIWDAEVRLGARVLVLGGGTIGTLIACLCQRAGATRTLLVEPNPDRQKRAQRLGVTHTAPTAPADADFDVVFEVTGNPRVLNDAIAACRAEGCVTVVSFYGERTSVVALGDVFHRRRLRLVASQVSSVAPGVRGRFDHDRRFEVVLQLLSELPVDALLATPVAFDSAATVYRDLAAGNVSGQLVFSYAAYHSG